MKKTLTRILILLALFIPTYAAIILYIAATDAPVNNNSVYAIDLIGPDGDKRTFSSSDSDEKKLIDLFLDINETAKNVQNLPEELLDTPHYTVTYYSYDLETDYEYYFSKTKPSNSYFVDHLGNVSRIDAPLTIEFLDSEYSYALYSSASTPAELKVQNETLLPSELDWYYYTYSAARHKAKHPLASTVDTIDLSYADIPMSFSIQPSSCFVEIRADDSSIVFSGSLDEYNSSRPIESYVRENMTLSVVVNASWEENVSIGYGGSAKYSFLIDCIYDPVPKFWLGESSIESGEFVVLSGANIENIDDIEFAAEPFIDFEPTFYRDGEHVRTLIPIKSELDLEGQKVVFTLTYEGEQSILTLNVKKSTLPEKTRKYNYGGKVKTSVRTESNLKKFSDFVTAVESSSSPYFNSYFVFDDLGNNRAVFGDIVNNGKENEKFRSDGLAFVAYQNGVISAVNDGVVVSVGNTAYGGITVVVDHGLGLRSVYYCMRISSVSVGDSVKRGDEIGKGSSAAGYSDGITAYMELWVEDTPVSYMPLLHSGRTSMIVFGDK